MALAASPVAAQDAVSALGDIIVTAQKREQSAVDVPIALTAYSGMFLRTWPALSWPEL